MVVQEEDEAPTEATTSKRSKFVVVKNHVRELLPENQNNDESSENQISENSNKMKRKQLKKKKFQKETPALEEECVSETDLEELKCMYNKCKTLLLKMESKYGHLLDLENSSKAKKRKYTSEESGSEDCSCSLVKKIIFDENGQQIEKKCQLENHICPKRTTNRYINSQPHTPVVQVEYDNLNVDLPDSLSELENILKDPNIRNVYRRMVIDKIYLTRQQYLNEIRYEKDFLIQKLKENPDELLDFKGTNISTLPGYPTKRVEKKYNVD